MERRGVRVAAGAGVAFALSDREQAILRMIASGWSCSEIAGELRISPRTVNKYSRNVYEKLGAGSRNDAVAKAIRGGLLEELVRGPIRQAGLPTPTRVNLTRRESEVLRAIARGETIRQTARTLGIADKTVEATRSRLFSKLHAPTGPAALIAAHRLGLVDLTE